MLYRLAFKFFFSKIDPEVAHHLGMYVIRLLGVLRLSKLVTGRNTNPKIRAMGIDFPGPFGLAAGFDKNAIAVGALGDLGFTHVEIGTVTRFAQPGNPKPRLFRLTKDRALINRMGFNNDGADKVAQRLAKIRQSGRELPVIGVNIGKSKVTDPSEAVSDYRYSAKVLSPFADYLAVNVSSPNTPGLRDLQSVQALSPILKAVAEAAGSKPVLVKIAPDLVNEDIAALAKLVRELNLAGVIATNTTISRAGLLTPESEVSKMGAGGLSGPVLANRAIEVLKILKTELADNQIVISVGGVETGADVAERIRNGATLVQGYTGFIYQGPFWARQINRQYWKLS